VLPVATEIRDTHQTVRVVHADVGAAGGRCLPSGEGHSCAERKHDHGDSNDDNATHVPALTSRAGSRSASLCGGAIGEGAGTLVGTSAAAAVVAAIVTTTATKAARESRSLIGLILHSDRCYAQGEETTLELSAGVVAISTNAAREEVRYIRTGDGILRSSCSTFMASAYRRSGHDWDTVRASSVSEDPEVASRAASSMGPPGLEPGTNGL
jgi:hypothetical protein